MPSVRDLLPSCPFYSPFGPNKIYRGTGRMGRDDSDLCKY